MKATPLLLAIAVFIGSATTVHAKREPIGLPEYCRVESISWSPDGRYFAAAGRISPGGAIGGVADERTRRPEKKCAGWVWDNATGDLVSRVAGTWIAWAPDSRRIAGATSKKLVISNAKTGAVIQTLDDGGGVFAWSPDGRLIASGDFRGAVKIWDTKSGKRLSRLEHDAGFWVQGIAWSPDGRYLATSINDVTLVWDVAEEEVVKTLQSVGELAWSPDGQYLAIYRKNEGTLWRTGSWERARSIGAASAFVWSPDSRFLYGLSMSTLMIKSAETGETIETVEQAGPLNGLGLSPDGKTLAYGDLKSAIWFVDLSAGK